MFYIYLNGECVGTSDRGDVGGLPQGYTVSEDPPKPKPTPFPKPFEGTPQPTPKSLDRFASHEITALKGRLKGVNPVVSECIELMLWTTRGDTDKANDVITKLKESLKSDG